MIDLLLSLTIKFISAMKHHLTDEATKTSKAKKNSPKVIWFANGTQI
jgi:hypothetical protein